MAPTESDSKKRSQDDRPLSPEVERSKRTKRSNVNSPKTTSVVQNRPESRGSRQSSFEEESRIDPVHEAKLIKTEKDKEQGRNSFTRLGETNGSNIKLILDFTLDKESLTIACGRRVYDNRHF